MGIYVFQYVCDVYGCYYLKKNALNTHSTLKQMKCKGTAVLYPKHSHLFAYEPSYWLTTYNELQYY